MKIGSGVVSGTNLTPNRVLFKPDWEASKLNTQLVASPLGVILRPIWMLNTEFGFLTPD